MWFVGVEGFFAVGFFSIWVVGWGVVVVRRVEDSGFYSEGFFFVYKVDC